ncbi:MAG: TetR/AcrR family transcriptional regulator [Sphingomonas adhaesiva]|uniref:TetR/AcrR family transcriptional regulator n=1 Tax=Sphingomonas adhaesiva TaxID=28212 RepID=UPI002FF4ED9C
MSHPRKSRAGGRPSQQRAAEISDAIVAATVEAFADHGMDFSMEQMAAAAGISKQAVYRRWPGKTDLLIHAIGRTIERLVARAADRLPGDPAAALREIAWRVFDSDEGQANRIGIFLQAEALRDGGLQRHMLGWHEALVQLLSARTRVLLLQLGKDEEAAPSLAAILFDLLSGARATLAWTGTPPMDDPAVFELRWQAFLHIVRASADLATSAIVPAPKS